MLALLLALAAPGAPPWQIWDDLARLAVAAPGHQVLLRSSHCPSGCRYDRTDAGDPRFLRIVFTAMMTKAKRKTIQTREWSPRPKAITKKGMNEIIGTASNAVM